MQTYGKLRTPQQLVGNKILTPGKFKFF